MGEQAFAVVGVLADADLTNLKSESNASFFDVFGLVMVVWPAMLNVPIALLALVSLVGLIVVHRDALRLRALVGTAVACIAVPALLFAAGWLLSYPLGIWPGVHPLDHAQPWPGRVAIVTAGILIPLLVAPMVGGRVDARALLLVNWTVLALLAVGVAVYVTARRIRSSGRYSASPLRDGSRRCFEKDRRARCAQPD